jgi:photosystem II stability/assembly factor-like uncharacterized protein
VIVSFTVNGDNIYTSIWGDGVYLSNNGGTNWTPINNGLLNPRVYALISNGSIVLAATTGNGEVFATSDSGRSWTPVNITQTQTAVRTFAEHDSNIFAGTEGNGVFNTKNNGRDWKEANLGLTDVEIHSLSVLDGSLYAGTWGQGVAVSSDSGNSWTYQNTGFTFPYTYINCFGRSGSYILAATVGGIFIKSNGDTIWNAVASELVDGNVSSLAVENGNVFASSDPDRIIHSNDNGENWSTVSSDFINPPGSEIIASVTCLAYGKYSLFAGTSGRGIFLSSDGGKSWDELTISPSDYITALNVKDSTVIAASWGIFLSTDGGLIWSPSNNGLPPLCPRINNIAFVGPYIFVGTDNSGIFLSADNGTSWTDINQGILASRILTINSDGSTLYAGTERGLWRRPINEIITDVHCEPEPLPSKFYLSQNYPNPFNSSTVIKYSIPIPCLVTIKVFDILGREIITLINEYKKPGNYSEEWLAPNSCSGIYFYQLRANYYKVTKKLMLLK